VAVSGIEGKKRAPTQCVLSDRGPETELERLAWQLDPLSLPSSGEMYLSPFPWPPIEASHYEISIGQIDRGVYGSK
jgi:hypothetical protein